MTTRPLLDALAIADRVIAKHSGHISTHYEGCYENHAGCLAVLIRDTLEGAS